MLEKSNYTLLYIEDEAPIQMVTTMLLESYFSEVYEASDGVEGLEVYRDKKPDVILTDIQMPNMDGLEFCKKIREEDKETPIIILTAYTTVEYLLQAINLNLIKYLGKPLQEADMEEALGECFDQLESKNPNVVRLGEDTYYDLFNQAMSIDGEIVRLTSSQNKFMEILLRHRDRVVNYSEIEYHISYDKPMSDDSLRTLVKRVRKIVGKETIETISKTGYKIKLYG